MTGEGEGRLVGIGGEKLGAELGEIDFRGVATAVGVYALRD